jgi:hypothetical protein
MPKREREDLSSGKESSEEPQPKKPTKLPDYSMYEAARKSVLANEHINNIVFHDDFYRQLMRQIQSTYEVKQHHWPNQGYGFRIRLIWDHDRLWGTFELGFFKGVFLIDPGPGQDHFQADDEYNHQHPDGEACSDAGGGSEGDGGDDDNDDNEDEDHPRLDFDTSSREYPLVWRGASTEMPDTILYSTLTIGKIRFGDGEIWGHFETMLGVGLPEDRCEFHGKRKFGPPVVSLSIQNVIDEWNEYGIFCDDEVPRQSSEKKEEPKIEIDDSTTASSPSIASNGETSAEKPEDKELFMKIVTGIFDVTSDAIEGEWQSMSRGLTIRFHVDKQQQKVWGYFNVGIVQGYLLLSPRPESLAPKRPMDFQWRGRERDTGAPSRGNGAVMFGVDRKVRGVFHGMCGEIDFKGRRKLMPSGISGRDEAFYRQGWEDHAH